MQTLCAIKQIGASTGRFFVCSLAFVALSFAADPLATRFAVSYNGSAPVRDVQVACNIDYLQFEPNTSTVANNAVIALMLRSMKPGEVQTASCLKIAGGLGALAKGRIHVAVTFTPQGLAPREQREALFETTPGPDHTVRWVPVTPTETAPFSIGALNSN